jgi:hypothetical protein
VSNLFSGTQVHNIFFKCHRCKILVTNGRKKFEALLWISWWAKENLSTVVGDGEMLGIQENLEFPNVKERKQGMYERGKNLIKLGCWLPFIVPRGHFYILVLPSDLKNIPLKSCIKMSNCSHTFCVTALHYYNFTMISHLNSIITLLTSSTRILPVSSIACEESASEPAMDLGSESMVLSGLYFPGPAEDGRGMAVGVRRSGALAWGLEGHRGGVHGGRTQCGHQRRGRGELVDGEIPST